MIYSVLEIMNGQRSLAGYSPRGHRVGYNSVTEHKHLVKFKLHSHEGKGTREEGGRERESDLISSAV